MALLLNARAAVAIPIGSHGFGVAFVFLLITVGVFSALWFVITFVLK
jgi:hypothetical protein